MPKPSFHSDPKLSPYAPPRTDGPIHLRLDKNEGRLTWRPPAGFWDRAVESLNRYPDATALTARLAGELGVDPTRILVTAGGDEALQRIALATLGPNREMLLATPTFEMLPRYAHQARGETVAVDWPAGPFPLAELRRRVSPRTGLIAVVSPNNPTGQIVSAEDLLELAAAVDPLPLLVDLAYTEFADKDLCAIALQLPNAIAVRTFSKARGLAGLRVGYAVAGPQWIERLRCFGNPFSVSSLALALAVENLDSGESAVADYVRVVREQRQQLAAWLQQRGIVVWPSQANFVLAEFPEVERVWRQLARQGIAVRKYAQPPELAGCLRITLPGDNDEFQYLLEALKACFEEFSSV